MAAATLISLDEYLKNSYEPDCDYVDGVLEKRNLGEWTHGRLQMVLGRYVGNRERVWRVRVASEVRVRVSSSRVRIPGLCIVSDQAAVEEVLIHPPLVCIESSLRKTVGLASNSELLNSLLWAFRMCGCSIPKSARSMTTQLRAEGS